MVDRGSTDRAVGTRTDRDHRTDVQARLPDVRVLAVLLVLAIGWARNARADPWGEVSLRGSWADAGARSPVSTSPALGTFAADEPVFDENEWYRAGPMAELALGYRFAVIPISIGLTGRYRASGTTDRAREDDERWGYGIGPYARAYLPLGRFELWGSVGVEWTMDTQRWTRDGVERRAVHRGIGFPFGLGVDVYLARHFAVGASAQVAPVLGVSHCWILGVGTPTRSQGAQSCQRFPAIDGDARTYTIVSGGLHVRVPWE